MAKTYYLTVRQLEKLGACPPGLERFKAAFGSRLALTPENAMRVAESGFRFAADIHWLARVTLDTPRYRAYHRAVDAASDAYLLKVGGMSRDERQSDEGRAREAKAHRERVESVALALCWHLFRQRKEAGRG